MQSFPEGIRSLYDDTGERESAPPTCILPCVGHKEVVGAHRPPKNQEKGTQNDICLTGTLVLNFFPASGTRRISMV